MELWEDAERYKALKSHSLSLILIMQMNSSDDKVLGFICIFSFFYEESGKYKLIISQNLDKIVIIKEMLWLS